MFTDNFLESLIPNSKGKYDVREKTRNGFTITVHPTGRRSFTFFYFFDGRKRRMTLGEYPYLSLTKARRLHKEALTILENGIDPALRKQLRIRDTKKHLYKEIYDRKYIDN